MTAAAHRASGYLRLGIDIGAWPHRPELGESIAINGCCLTVSNAPEPAPSGGSIVEFDVVPETLSCTTLGKLKVGSLVNLERSLRASDLLGGHFVQGHIEGVGRVLAIDQTDGWRVRIAPPPSHADGSSLMECITPKGGIAVEGVSLTVAAVDPAAGWFEVALIPTTLELTTLSALQPGHGVNLETDILARTVLHYLRHFTRDHPSAPHPTARSTLAAQA